MSDLREQVETCAVQARKWKETALSAASSEQTKAMEKAFFWLELQSAFTFLWAVEQTQGRNPAVKKKLIFAKANLTRKLADYADKICKELKVG